MIKKIIAVIYKKEADSTKFLLLKRPKENTGIWNFVTGKARKDEKLLDTALREVKEETGLKAEKIVDLDYSYEFSYRDKDKRFKEFAFVVKANTSNVTLSPEHIKYCWCSFNKAMKLIKHQTNKKALEKACKTLKTKNNEQD